MNAIGTNEVGPSFGTELVAAGLGGLPFTWSAAGRFEYSDAITQEQREAIEAVFAAHNPAKAALLAYANMKQWSLAIGGYTVTIGGTPRRFETDPVSQGLITGKAMRLTQANPPATVRWQFGNTFVSIPAADFMAAAIEIADFVQATFDTLEAVIADIEGLQIGTTGQIDAASWPAASSN